jgi:glycosyltransferase involved in cell wall biosynthesis
MAAMPDCDVNVGTYYLTAHPVCDSGKGRPAYHMQHHEVLLSNRVHWQEKAASTYRLPMQKVANSTWLKREIESTYGATHIPIVNPAIDHTVFWDRRIRTSDGPLRIVSLGRPEARKGFPELLSAMKLVLAEHREVEWVVFGAHRPPYQDDAAPYSFVRLPINNVLAELYSSSHIAVNPSWYESFPLPPLEAMACGCAVVTTVIGTEDYAVDEETALVVPARDSQALARAISRLITSPNLRATLAKAGLQRARSFTWNATVSRMERILESIPG